jgi:hypothetical protein
LNFVLISHLVVGDLPMATSILYFCSEILTSLQIRPKEPEKLEPAPRAETRADAPETQTVLYDWIAVCSLHCSPCILQGREKWTPPHPSLEAPTRLGNMDGHTHGLTNGKLILMVGYEHI